MSAYNGQPLDPAAGDGEVTMELEHAIGYLAIPGGLHYHPNGKDFVYAAGGTVIVCDISDPHAQVSASDIL